MTKHRVVADDAFKVVIAQHCAPGQRVVECRKPSIDRSHLERHRGRSLVAVEERRIAAADRRRVDGISKRHWPRSIFGSGKDRDGGVVRPLIDRPIGGERSDHRSEIRRSRRMRGSQRRPGSRQGDHRVDGAAKPLHEGGRPHTLTQIGTDNPDVDDESSGEQDQQRLSDPRPRIAPEDQCEQCCRQCERGAGMGGVRVVADDAVLENHKAPEAEEERDDCALHKRRMSPYRVPQACGEDRHRCDEGEQLQYPIWLEEP